MINPQWLRSFAAVAELGSFTRAAERLGLTQAAVSQHVGQLEARLGALLIRRPRQMELTPAGDALLDYWGDMERAEQRLDDRLTSTDHTVGEVSIVTPGSVGLSMYPRLLALQEAHPGLVIRHRFAPDQEVVRAVLDKTFELGIVTLRPDEPRLSATRFAEEPLELVVSAGAEVEGWEDLQRIGFIDHPDGQAMATRLLSRYYPGSPGIRSVPCRGFSNQISLILEPVARGLGFTVLPAYARAAFRDPAALRVIAGSTPVVDTLWLIHRAEWPLSPRAAFAVQQLRANMHPPG
ncbi:MAG TPA: LysR family transcriptional regulator [Telluria sp.]